MCKNGCGKPTYNGKPGEKCGRGCVFVAPAPPYVPPGGAMCVNLCGKPSYNGKAGEKCGRGCVAGFVPPATCDTPGCPNPRGRSGKCSGCSGAGGVGVPQSAAFSPGAPCFHCKATVPPTNKFCSGCGKGTDCAKCGAKKITKFCSTCGNNHEAPPAAPPAPVPVPYTPAPVPYAPAPAPTPAPAAKCHCGAFLAPGSAVPYCSIDCKDKYTAPAAAPTAPGGKCMNDECTTGAPAGACGPYCSPACKAYWES